MLDVVGRAYSERTKYPPIDGAKTAHVVCFTLPASGNQQPPAVYIKVQNGLKSEKWGDLESMEMGL